MSHARADGWLPGDAKWSSQHKLSFLSLFLERARRDGLCTSCYPLDREIYCRVSLLRFLSEKEKDVGQAERWERGQSPPSLRASD